MIACEKLFKLLHDFLATTFAKDSSSSVGGGGGSDDNAISNDNENNRIAVVYVEILMLDQLYLDDGTGMPSGGDEDKAMASKSEDTVSRSFKDEFGKVLNLLFILLLIFYPCVDTMLRQK